MSFSKTTCSTYLLLRVSFCVVRSSLSSCSGDGTIWVFQQSIPLSKFGSVAFPVTAHINRFWYYCLRYSGFDRIVMVIPTFLTSHSTCLPTVAVSYRTRKSVNISFIETLILSASRRCAFLMVILLTLVHHSHCWNNRRWMIQYSVRSWWSFILPRFGPVLLRHDTPL